MSGLEIASVAFVIWAVMLTLDEGAATMKKAVCWTFAASFTLFFVFNLYPGSAQVEKGKVTHLGWLHAGFPARSFNFETAEKDTIACHLSLKFAGDQTIDLSFKTGLFDSSGVKGYGLTKAQAYYDVVRKPYSNLQKFYAGRISEDETLKENIRQFAASGSDSLGQVITDRVMAFGQPFGLRFVTCVKAQKGGDRS